MPGQPATYVVKQYLLLLRWKITRLNRRQFLRWVYKHTRPASYPYISGDGFRRLANYVYDETCQYIPAADVRNGDVIFIATDYVRGFFDRLGPRIAAKYAIITHNSDLAVDGSLVSLAGTNVTEWFAQNNVWQDEKVVPIPIGLENLHHYHAGIPQQFTTMRQQTIQKKNRILLGFAIGTNAAERQPAYDLAMGNPHVDCLPNWSAQQEYMRTLASYRFVLAPPGNGIDTHRAWEAMYLGVIPIVKESVAMRSFERLGLPLWIVRSWEELRSIGAVDLDRKYEELKTGFCSPCLFMDYWRELIRHKQGTNAAGRAA